MKRKRNNNLAKHIYAVLASGRGSNFKAILKAVDDGSLPHLPAVLLVDNAVAPAMDIAKSYGIETLFINPKEYKGKKKFGVKIVAEMKKRDVDTLVLAGFMRIIAGNVVKAFQGRIINIHPSLLPAFTGLDAQKQALDAGVKEAGCTVHFVDEGIDTGAVIAQAKVSVERGDTAESLSARILKQEHKIYPQTLALILNDKVKLVNGKALFD